MFCLVISYEVMLPHIYIDVVFVTPELITSSSCGFAQATLYYIPTFLQKKFLSQE